MTVSPIYFKGLVTVLALAGLFVPIAIPLILRKVPPNRVYGFRTPKMLKRDKVWYETNAYFGWALIFSSLISVIAIAAIYSLADLAPDLYLKVSLLAFAG